MCSLLIEFRRLIGRRFEDPIVKKDVESWPFKVVDQGGNPVVEVEYLGETKTFSPQEISSMVLMKVTLPWPLHVVSLLRSRTILTYRTR